uniref:hypothetical protein n=1 Tax=Xenorhabdus eapokensis TaxID=1873482 RepID=UPI000A6B3793
RFFSFQQVTYIGTYLIWADRIQEKQLRSKKIPNGLLEEAGMLVKAEKDRFISKTISVNGTQGRFVVLIFRDED